MSNKKLTLKVAAYIVELSRNTDAGNESHKTLSILYRSFGKDTVNAELDRQFSLGSVKCNMEKDCTETVTHIGEKGYLYCSRHAGWRQGIERCRKVRKWELDLVRAGKPLPSFEPIRKPGVTQT